MNRAVGGADKFHHLDGLLSIFLGEYFSAPDVELFRRHRQPASGNAQKLIAHQFSRYPSGRHQNHRRAAAAGAKAVRRRQSIAMNHGDLVERNTDLTGNNLRDRSLMSLSLLTHTGK